MMVGLFGLSGSEVWEATKGVGLGGGRPGITLLADSDKMMWLMYI